MMCYFKTGVRRPESEVRSPKSEVRSPESGVRKPESELLPVKSNQSQVINSSLLSSDFRLPSSVFRLPSSDSLHNIPPIKFVKPFIMNITPARPVARIPMVSRASFLFILPATGIGRNHSVDPAKNARKSR
jgi:hypothetical protein